MDSTEHEEAVLFFSNLIEKNFTEICDILQVVHPETVDFLTKHFGSGYNSPVHSSPRGFSNRVKRRIKRFRKSLPSHGDASSSFNEPSDFSGQIFLLKDLLNEENINRQHIEASLCSAKFVLF